MSRKTLIAITFGVEKQEWCGYPMLKKFDDMFIIFERIHERDGEMDRQRTTAFYAVAGSQPVTSACAYISISYPVRSHLHIQRRLLGC